MSSENYSRFQTLSFLKYGLFSRTVHSAPTNRDIPDPLKRTRLGDLCIIETLGVGGFGRVELVQIGEDTSQTYALKQIKKCHVVEMKQQDHILNERRILLECKSDFIIRWVDGLLFFPISICVRYVCIKGTCFKVASK